MQRRVMEKFAKYPGKLIEKLWKSLLRLPNNFFVQTRDCAPVQTSKKSYFGINDIEGLRLLTHLRVQFSDLCEHELRHEFQCSSPMCLCQTGIENNEHLFLHCPCHSNHCRDLLGRIPNVVDIDIGTLSSKDIFNLLFRYGNSRFLL